MRLFVSWVTRPARRWADSMPAAFAIRSGSTITANGFGPLPSRDWREQDFVVFRRQ